MTLRVLIVDDKPQNLDLLTTILQSSGCEVDEARHGAEALIKARQSPPAIIISDLLMPVMDGYTLLRHWRSDARLRSIPFVVYTATYTEPKDEKLAFNLGADAFILKPAAPETFMARIQGVLEQHRTGDFSVQTLQAATEVSLKDYSDTLIRKLEEKTLQLEQSNRDLKEREASLHSLVKGTSGVGSDFFAALVSELTVALQVRYAFVGKLLQQERIGMVAVWGDGHLAENFEYDMKGTPCSNVVGKTMCHYPVGVAKQFPEDRMLVDMGVEAYLAMPLFAADGRALGLLAVLHDKELPLAQTSRDLLNIFTGRAAAELERIETEAELRALFASMNDKILVFDADGRHLKVAPTNPTSVFKREVNRVGKTVHEIYPPELADFFLKNIRRSLKEASRLNVEYVVPIDGKDAWFDCSVSPMSDDSVVWVARDVTDQKRAENERKAIFEIIQGAIKAPNLDEYLKLVHRSISEIIYAENCFVMLPDPATELHHFVFWADKFDPVPEPGPSDKGFSSLVLRSGKPQLITKEKRQALFDQGLAEQVGSTSPSWIGVPLKTPTSTIGVLAVQHYEIENAYSERDLEFLASVGDQVALAIERKRSDQLLAESRERYHDLVENAIDIIYTHDLNGNYTSVNAAVERVAGYTTEEALAMNLTQSVAPEYIGMSRQMIVDKLAGKPVTAYELEIIAKDGRRIPLEVNTRIVYQDGVATGVQGIARDITERRQQEKARLASERKYKDIFNLAPVGIYQSSVDGTLLTANNALADMLGYDSTADLLQVNLADIYLTKHERDKLVAEYQDIGYVVDLDIQWRRNDGSPIWVQLTAHTVTETDGNQFYFEGFVRDVTEKKQAIEALRDSDEKFHQLADNIADVFWIRSTDLNELIYVSPAYEQVWGRTVESLHAQPDKWMEFVLPEDRELVRAAFAALNDEQPRLNVDYRIVRPDGEIRWVRTRAFPVRDAAGKLFRYAGIVSDITEARKADEALRESEASNRAMLESALDCLVAIDHEGTIIEFNPSAERTFGFTRDEAIGHEMAELIIPPGLRESHRRGLKRYLENGKGPAIGRRLELSAVRKSGEEFPIELTIAHIAGSMPPAFTGFIRDMTESKRTEAALKLSEDQLRQSQKMEAVGQLAGGIAHDFNNLLTAITGYSELSLSKMPADDPLRHNVSEIKEAGTRAAELTSQLLAFSRKQVLKPIVHNVNSSITNIEKMLRRIIKENIELRTILDPDVGNIKADPGQIEQVIMNLVVNARDAMPNGGRLTIETQNYIADDEYLALHIGATPGHFVKITFTDTGEGMDKQTQNQMFEPFFTTKDVGKGTGLGLSTVHGIVKQSGGDITVYSEVGHGTILNIYLPRVEEDIQKHRWLGDSDDDLSGSESILLVEDEEVVRNLVSEILTGYGYNVLEANSGKAALAICETGAESIQLVLSDVVMPKMSGPELKVKLAELYPEIKVLFMSGYTDGSISESGILDSSAAFIEKPFSPDSLARKVRDFLDT